MDPEVTKALKALQNDLNAAEKRIDTTAALDALGKNFALLRKSFDNNADALSDVGKDLRSTAKDVKELRGDFEQYRKYADSVVKATNDSETKLYDRVAKVEDRVSKVEDRVAKLEKDKSSQCVAEPTAPHYKPSPRAHSVR